MAAKEPEARQIHNQNILLNFGAAVQQQDVQINVPFLVRKMVIHPPRHNLAIAGALNDQYFLYSTLNKGNGIIGFVDTAITGVQQAPLTVIFDTPVQVNGYHKFQVRCFTEAGGGNAADLTAKVWCHIEFHNAP